MSESALAQALGQGVSLITLPLPFRAPPSVNAYVIEGGEGLTLIDCGTDWPEGLRDPDRRPGGGRSRPRRNPHPGRHAPPPRSCRHGCRASTREWGVKTVMHSRAAKLVDRYNDTEGYFRRTTGPGRPPRGSAGQLRGLRRRRSPGPSGCRSIDPPDQMVDDGDRISIDRDRHFEVLHTPGHEPAHICLRDSRTGVLFSGDHILPRITPFVGYDELFDDVLGDFLESLARIEQLQVGLTYPAHGALVEHGSARAEQLLAHHQRRLARHARGDRTLRKQRLGGHGEGVPPQPRPDRTTAGAARDDRPPRAPATARKARSLMRVAPSATGCQLN